MLQRLITVAHGDLLHIALLVHGRELRDPVLALRAGVLHFSDPLENARLAVLVGAAVKLRRHFVRVDGVLANHAFDLFLLRRQHGVVHLDRFSHVRSLRDSFG